MEVCPAAGQGAEKVLVRLLPDWFEFLQYCGLKMGNRVFIGCRRIPYGFYSCQLDAR